MLLCRTFLRFCSYICAYCAACEQKDQGMLVFVAQFFSISFSHNKWGQEMSKMALSLIGAAALAVILSLVVYIIYRVLKWLNKNVFEGSVLIG